MARKNSSKNEPDTIVETDPTTGLESTVDVPVVQPAEGVAAEVAAPTPDETPTVELKAPKRAQKVVDTFRIPADPAPPTKPEVEAIAPTAKERLVVAKAGIYVASGGIPIRLARGHAVQDELVPLVLEAEKAGLISLRREPIEG